MVLQNDRLLAEKTAQVEALRKSHAALAEKHAEASNALKNSEELLQSLLTGLGNSAGSGGGGYMGQLADARVRVANAAAEEKQNKTKLAMSERELASLETRWKAVEREAGEGKKNLDKTRKEVEAARRKVQECGWSAEKEQEAENTFRAAKEAEQRARMVRADCVYVGYLLISPLGRREIGAHKACLPFSSIIPHLDPIGTGQR